MPTMHFTKGGVDDLSFAVELKKLMKKRGKDAFVPKVIDFFEATGKKGRTCILTLTQAGNKIWSVQYFYNGKARRQKIGYVDHSDDKFPKLSHTEAMDIAWNFDVQEAMKPKAGSFKDVAEVWFKSEVEGNLRSAREIRRQLDKYILPRWKDRPFAEISRLDVNELLDKVSDGRKHVRQADYVLATVRKLMKWRQAQDGHYESPIVPGMKRDKRKPDERARDRILDDAEIKTLWETCYEFGQFGSICRLALLSAQRRDKIATMKWTDIDADGVWTIATEKGEKGNAKRIKLPKRALDIIEAQPRIDDLPFVFATTRGRKDDHFNSWGKCKAKLDAKLNFKEPWVIHDLRRTSRSLMSRLGVITEVAEAVMGHKQKGVVGVYNRHTYEPEMAAALQRVANHIDGLLNPNQNVVALKGKKRKAA